MAEKPGQSVGDIIARSIVGDQRRYSAGDVLARTKSPAVVISPTDNVLTALGVMAERNIGALLVTEGERLVGILSERDCVRKLDLKGRKAAETAVGDIMTRDVLSVTSDRLIVDCRRIMSERRFRHLPVVDEGRVSGMLSMRDVLEEVIAEEERQIQNLETERLAINKGLY